eukprot:SAG22_NODE_69_length_22779_cov_71.088139_4_plen_181_part_00
MIATVRCERSGTARKGRETEEKAVITAFKREDLCQPLVELVDRRVPTPQRTRGLACGGFQAGPGRHPRRRVVLCDPVCYDGGGRAAPPRQGVEQARHHPPPKQPEEQCNGQQQATVSACSDIVTAGTGSARVGRSRGCCRALRLSSAIICSARSAPTVWPTACGGLSRPKCSRRTTASST